MGGCVPALLSVNLMLGIFLLVAFVGYSFVNVGGDVRRKCSIWALGYGILSGCTNCARVWMSLGEASVGCPSWGLVGCDPLSLGVTHRELLLMLFRRYLSMAYGLVGFICEGFRFRFFVFFRMIRSF